MEAVKYEKKAERWGIWEIMLQGPSEGNHGPVRVAGTYHFAYEDGTPYYSIGTTCYVWELQSDERIKETIASLKEARFNKIRFCIFPKHYAYNFEDPRSFPYEGMPMDHRVLTDDNFNEYTELSDGNEWDFSRFNPEHYAHIEKCIEELGYLGIEADLIVMHPYDRWGFSCMTKEQDALYWKYVAARFAAYRNVWWSLANEYDLMKHKTLDDWEGYAKILCDKDPYNHLRSIHNCHGFYDYNRPWVTHCSIQRQEPYLSAEYVAKWRETYKKPIVLDEICYEGNLQFGWGNISGKELLRRFWEGSVRGGYVGHGLAPYDLKWDCVCGVPECEWMCRLKSYYLIYYGFTTPIFKEFYFDDTTEFEVEVIDTWNMIIKKTGIVKGKFKVALPGREYMAVRLRKRKE